MRILAVESSSATASVAVLQDGKLLGEISINNQMTHSQTLMPMLDELMMRLQLDPQDIDFYAASIGPGSFTGLRIGVSIIKGIAYAAQKPVVAVPTLEAMAEGFASFAGIVCPMLDARNNQVFTAIFSGDGCNITKTTEVMGVTIEEAINECRAQIALNPGKKVLFTGDGAVLHMAVLQETFGVGCTFPKAARILNSAVDVAVVAKKMIENGETTDSMSIKPFYLRKSQAERLADDKNLTESEKMKKNV